MSLSLTAGTALATSIVAVFALILTFRGWQDNRDKLRLDLFNRRFSVYLRVLAFYQQLIVWEDSPEQKALIQPFIEASREARFIFPHKSGIYEFIHEFWEHAWKVTRFSETNQAYKDPMMHAESLSLYNDRMVHVQWILASLDTLEAKMAKSMNFDRL